MEVKDFDTYYRICFFFKSNKCGNPTQLGRCYQCKAEIGGESSKLRVDNAKDIGYELNRKDFFLFWTILCILPFWR